MALAISKSVRLLRPGLVVSYGSAGNCTIAGSAAHITGAGLCTVTASQAGDANYNAATDVMQSFTIAKANQTITFGALANATFGDADVALGATASSGLAVSYGSAGNCTIAGSAAHITGAGTCTVTASQAGDANYNAATDVPQSFTIAKAGQTITFVALPDKMVGAADFTVTATATSGLGVAFAAAGNCTINSATVHLTGAGTCTITASQAGSANYNAATNVPRTFNIADFNLGTQGGGSTTATVNAGSTATYNLHAAAVGGFVGTVTLACSGAPDKANCTIAPTSVNLTGAATAVNYTVTVTTTGKTLAGIHGTGGKQFAWMVASFGCFGAVLLFGNKKRRMQLGSIAVIAFVVFLNGCGSGGFKSNAAPGTPAGTYTLTVTATSGGITHTQQLTLKVQ